MVAEEDRLIVMILIAVMNGKADSDSSADASDTLVASSAPCKLLSQGRYSENTCTYM